MNLSLLALNLLLTSIHCRTKFKMLSIDHKAFYCLDPTYFPILIFTILSSPIQEFYTQVSWTNCSSCSLDLLTLLTLLGTSSSPLLFHSSSISDAHQFPHKIFSFPQEELISCISQVSQPSAHISVVVLIPFCFVLFMYMVVSLALLSRSCSHFISTNAYNGVLQLQLSNH